VQPLAGTLVVDLTRYLPGAYAGRELLRLGARVVRIEPPDGDPMRAVAPGWDAALNAGKESVAVDLKNHPELGLRLLERADVVLEGFRPGVADRLGIGPGNAAETAVYCSITGFGHDTRHVGRAGHDLNYLGWAGTLADTAPAPPPVQVADLAAGALTAVTQILAALLQRAQTGLGSRLVVSMTHESHRLAAHRLGGEPVPRLLTGGLACYRTYATADGRWLTIAALEPQFFRRLCELVDRPQLSADQLDPDAQEAVGDQLAEIFAAKPLDAWLQLFDGEDVCAGPVATLAEANEEFGHEPDPRHAPRLGEHTDAWRTELGL
jgi:alpha-methylacyl-CoA racemase